jgi:hypothetical protein
MSPMNPISDATQSADAISPDPETVDLAAVQAQLAAGGNDRARRQALWRQLDALTRGGPA